MIRSFLGLPLPQATTRQLESLQNGLPVARPVPAENMHVTLAFLDDQPRATLEELAAALDEMRWDALEIRLSGIQLLGGKQPSAIAVGADGGGELDRLHARVVRLCRETGLDLQRRKFRPHVTVFRMSKGAETAAHPRIQSWITDNARFEPMTFMAESLALYRSILHKSGASYDILAEFPSRKNIA